MSYLAKREQPVWRQRLQHAYNRPEYDEALAALQSLQHELEDRNQSAAGSLAEGLDETLTLHRRCFRHPLLLPHPYLVLTKPLRLDIQCQRGASVKIGWKYLDD